MKLEAYYFDDGNNMLPMGLQKNRSINFIFIEQYLTYKGLIIRKLPARNPFNSLTTTLTDGLKTRINPFSATLMTMTENIRTIRLFKVSKPLF